MCSAKGRIVSATLTMQLKILEMLIITTHWGRIHIIPLGATEGAEWMQLALWYLVLPLLHLPPRSQFFMLLQSYWNGETLLWWGKTAASEWHIKCSGGRELKLRLFKTHLCGASCCHQQNWALKCSLDSFHISLYVCMTGEGCTNTHLQKTQKTRKPPTHKNISELGSWLG